MPVSVSFHPDGDRFTFDIDVAFPLIGHVIHYKGWLVAMAAAGDHMGIAGANEG